MFLLFALLSELGRLHARLDSEGILLHVTVPWKIRSNESENSEKQVIYIITIDEKPYTLHLRKHSFLSHNFLVYAYNETGFLHSESSYFKMHCHYQGYVADIPNSLATLSICSGLRGFLQFGNITFGIEPLESSASFEHIIYQVKNDDPDIPLLAENYSNSWQKNQPYKDNLSSQEPTLSELLPQYLEIHITVEKGLYDYMGSEMMAVTQKIIQIIGLVNTMFTQFKLTVMLSSLELWSDKNKISTNGDADDLLQRFFIWKRDYLILRPHDIAFLLIYRKHPTYFGATFPGTICNNSYEVDIAMLLGTTVLLSVSYSDAITLEGFSVIIAQLLGLKMGLTFDDINTCSCPRATCIMDRKAVGSSGIKFFSNCSMHDYRYFVSKFETKCLQNFPNLQPLYQNQSVCGNGILEPNEECDCGSQEECQFKKCCDFNTCKLKGSAKCGSGPCCTSNCEISVAGTPCRKIIDQECDFTEYCNGTSSNCVPDTYASNGMLCRLGTAYCYNGRCQTTDNQCAQIFGEGAQGAPFACFKEINSLHDKFGNCGFKNSQPLPCDQKDVLCGKLACVWPHKNTYKNDVRSAVYSYIQGHACISMTTGLSVRSDGRDYAYVADGTVCGAQMYCINKTCRKVHLMGYNCNAIAKCRGNGICNNLGNCHCFPGYRPPYCEFQIGSPGGSIDDGNVKKSDIIFIKEDYNAQQNNWLILSFYIVLPFIIIFTIMIIKRNEMRKSCKRENAEYEGERERGRDTGKEKSKCQAGNLTWNSILGPGSPWTPGCRLHQTAVPPGLPENLQCLDVVLKLSLIPGTSKCLSLVVSNTVKKVSSEFL
ncbi:disintegrin and metalloproteinase domain-containing protein 18 isoform X1 [Canis lupus familiaris]|uniref:disintegrin and metalloproteinase domain-containing protein 18 isoform X1 n=1 Tax=Canis lupus familiaris TaxID=9615 RepID=UPI0015F13DA5|nr:disintegrin and metalloproteinase domain-containing protein 18 isoform X1 [Canis lupus familiaris]